MCPLHKNVFYRNSLPQTNQEEWKNIKNHTLQSEHNYN